MTSSPIWNLECYVRSPTERGREKLNNSKRQARAGDRGRTGDVQLGKLAFYR